MLKISLPVTFGREVIAPLLPDFLLKYPQIQIDAHFLDRTVDMVSEGFDMVVRVGIIRDSSLIARRASARSAVSLWRLRPIPRRTAYQTTPEELQLMPVSASRTIRIGRTGCLKRMVSRRPCVPRDR